MGVVVVVVAMLKLLVFAVVVAVILIVVVVVVVILMLGLLRDSGSIESIEKEYGMRVSRRKQKTRVKE